MAIMAIFHSPNMTKAQYDALRPIVNWETHHPDGVLLHSCAFDEAGGLHVVDLWESPEKLQHFFETRLGPGFAQLGIDAGEPQIFPAHNINAFPPLERYAI